MNNSWNEYANFGISVAYFFINTFVINQFKEIALQYSK